jgi:hypothetical protein
MKKARGVGVIARMLNREQNECNVAPSLKKIRYDETSSEFLRLVKSRIEIRKGYTRLGAVLIFLVMYVGTILLQQNIEDAYSVESR